MRKNFIAGAALLALLMNSPQACADDIVVFGGEFEDETTPLPPTKIEKPEPTKDLPKPPEQKPLPPPKFEPAPQPIEPVEEPLPVKPAEQPPAPQQPIDEPQPIEPVEEPLPVKPAEQPPAPQQPIDEPQPIEPVEPLPQTEIDQPFDNPPKISGERESFNEPVIIEPQPLPRTIEPTPRYNSTPRQAPPPSNLKTLKQRFIKLAVDDTYTYYLDKTSVQWRKMPYSTSEYIADVWVRMVEREPKSLDADMASYGADNYNAEISLAREQGYQYSPEDLKVLRSQAYVLEHYYLRPKTNQIQFLCELEVFGRPQNTVNERAYDYRHWENLVPGSVESIIYAATIKIIGKGKADPKGHMTFTDMLDEYLRISL